MLSSTFHKPTPAGFRDVRVGRRQSMWVADGQDAETLAESILTSLRDVDAETHHMGRARLRSLSLGGSSDGLVRSYRHGGVFRHWTRDWFFTWPPRPFVELRVTEEARRRGIGTLEVIAALVVRGWGPFYRGWLVTRKLERADDLWTVFRATDPAPPATTLMETVGTAVRRMHQAGVYHADLNMRNLLVRVERSDVEVFVIDFDKGRVFDGAVPPFYRRRNLARLLRSVRKLDPARRYVSDADWSYLLAAYHD